MEQWEHELFDSLFAFCIYMLYTISQEVTRMYRLNAEHITGTDGSACCSLPIVTQEGM